jgi:xanthine dehydrogenase YagS FAD-binding subunit
MLPQFSYTRPNSLDDALAQLSGDGAVPHAGGSDLLGCLRDGVFEAHKVVSLSALDELRGIRQVRSGGIAIGALTSVAEVAANPLVTERYTALAQAAAAVASPQLRNQGTIGGNICQRPRCWYFRGEFHCLRKGGGTCYALVGENQFHCVLGGERCYIVHPSDTSAALVALAATAHIAGPDGTRTVPLDEFFVLPGSNVQRENVLEPGEIVTEIVLPRPARGYRSSYRKVRGRGAWDFALAGVALGVQFDGNRVRFARAVLSGAAPIPWRSHEIESVISGTSLDAGTCANAANAAMRNAQPLSRNGYKLPLFRGLIEQELLAMGSA